MMPDDAALENVRYECPDASRIRIMKDGTYTIKRDRLQ